MSYIDQSLIEGECIVHRLLHHRMNSQPPGDFLVNRIASIGSGWAGLRGENLGRHAVESRLW